MNFYQHLGWPVSPYTAKTSAYLDYKKIPHIDSAPTAFALMGKIRRAVGRPVMPTVITPEGEFWQDTSEIIDSFEALYPEPSIIPLGPTQRLAAFLLELHGDEWLTTLALHFRWNVPENARFAIEEFGRYALPWAPSFLRRPIAKRFANAMQRYLPVVGAVGRTKAGVENYATRLLDMLESHLAQFPFLLGTRPCLGDFSLFGPLWAHLYRDPGSTHLFDDKPAIRKWFEALLEPSGEPGQFLPDDVIPQTLDPLFRGIYDEQFVFLQKLVAQIKTYCEAHPEADRVPRALGEASFSIGGVEGSRKLVTFSQWMLQRVLDAYTQTQGAQREAVDLWLERVGGDALKELHIEHRMVRRNFREFLDKSKPTPS